MVTGQNGPNGMSAVRRVAQGTRSGQEVVTIRNPPWMEALALEIMAKKRVATLTDVQVATFQIRSSSLNKTIIRIHIVIAFIDK